MILPSRRVAAAFFCVFILGAIAGGVISLNFADLRFYNFLNRTNDPASLADRIDKKLIHDYQLDADEQARIAPLAQEMAQNLYRLRHKFATDVLATMDDSHQKIALQMTPDQRAAYQKANEDKHRRAVSMLMPQTVPSGQPPQ
jgi:hypothetical protein